MHSCPSCERPLLHAEATCPFCKAPQSALRRAAVSIGRGMMMVVTPVVLAACYGPPNIETGKQLDEDGDSYPADEDCDDTDPTVNPEATEVCDDEIDNDCDGLTDADDTDDCGS